MATAKAGSATLAVDTAAIDDVWRRLNGDEYELADVFSMSADRVAALRGAAARAWDIICAVAPIARALPDDILSDFGIPAIALDAVRRVDRAAGETLVGRFDFIETPDGFRVIEFNAETPFFIVESHRLSGIAARARGFLDPNAGCAERLAEAIATAIGANGPRTHVAVAAHDGAAEDRATAHYLRDLIETGSAARTTYAPLSTLRVRDDGLWSTDGRIDVLYRLYPLEQLAADRPAARIFALIADARLRLLNPPTALIAQSKMLMVLIWGLAGRSDIFDEHTCATIRQTFLPTFADLPDDGQIYVSKCVLGREGDSTSIVFPDGSTIESTKRRYDGQPRVYQQFVSMPAWSAKTPSGKRVDGRVVTSCFIVGGSPGAIGVRLGSEITETNAYFAPVGMVQ